MNTIIINNVKYELVPINEEVYSDWRIPTVHELLSLIDYDKYEPATDLNINHTGFLWSSCSYASGTSYAWSVDPQSGHLYTNSKSSSLYVICVRDGKDGLEWATPSKFKMNWKEALQHAAYLKTNVYYKSK